MGGLLGRLPRGDRDEDLPWGRRHGALILVLAGLGPLLLATGLLAGASAGALVAAVAVPLLAAAAGRLLDGRRAGAAVVTVGLTGTCVALVALTGGAPEASLAFVVAVVLLGAYGDWVPPACATAAAVLVDAAALLWGLFPAMSLVPRFALLHGATVVLTCVAVVALLALSERERTRHEHAEATSRLLLDLARRPAALPAAQRRLLWVLEESERDPYVREELRRAGVLAARMRRDAESLLVLSGRLPDRADPEPATLREVIGTAVAAVDGGDRVAVSGDDGASVVARTVADLTQVLAELVDNAVRHSGPGAAVQVVVRAHGWGVGSQQIVVTDAGPGMDGADREAANRLLGGRDARRPGGGVGLAVVARLAARHRIEVSLREGTGSGLVAVLVLPESVLVAAGEGPDGAVEPAPRRETARSRQRTPSSSAPSSAPSSRTSPPAPSGRPAGDAGRAEPAPPVPVAIPVAPVVRVVPTVHATHHATPHPTGQATHTPAHAPHAAHRRVPPSDPATLPATAPPTVPSPAVRGRHARRAAGADDLPATAPIALPEVAPVPVQPDLSAGWFDAAGPEVPGHDVPGHDIPEPEVQDPGEEVEASRVEAEEAEEVEEAEDATGSVAAPAEPAEVDLPAPRASHPVADEGEPSASFPAIPTQVRRSTGLIRPYTVPAPPAPPGEHDRT